MATESEEQLRKLLETLGQSMNETSDVFDEAAKLTKKFNKDFKEIQPTTKAFKDILSGTKTEIENMNVAAKKFDAAIKKAADSADVVEEALNSEAKAITLNSIAQHNAKAAASNFAIGLGGVAKTMLSGATEFVKGLQGTAEGTELVGQAAVRAAEATGKFATSLGPILDTLGMLAIVLGPGKITKAIGYGLTALGVGLEAFGPALTEAATEGLKILNTEVEKTKKSFRDITSTGAEFAGGMTELRQIAFTAGLDIAQLSTAVKSNTEYLSQMGLGIAESTRRFGKISSEIRNGKLGIQLSNLGLTVEEQNEMIMLSSSMLNASGKLRNMNEKDAAAAVVALTKDLKVLQNITGEDAKKKLAQARSDALEADILAEARALDGEEGVAKVQAVLREFPDELRTGILQAISTRGEAIVDPATAQLIARVPMVGETIQAAIADLQNSQVTAAQITSRTQDNIEALKVSMAANPEQMRDLARSNRLSPGGGPPGLADTINMFNKLSAKGVDTEQGVAKQTRDAVNQAADTLDGLTKRISTTDAEIQAAKAEFGNEMTGLITMYAASTGFATDALAGFTEALKKSTTALNEKNISSGKSGTPSTDTTKTPSFFDKLYDSTFPVKDRKFNTDVPLQDPFNKTGKKFGGISTGPMSGYQEVLHGTEAVVPLPDNRSIPVTLTNSQSNSGTMDTKEMVSAINQQSGLLNQILVAMQRNNQLTSGILQTSY